MSAADQQAWKARLEGIRQILEPIAMRTKTPTGGQELLIWSFALDQHGLTVEDFARGMMMFMATQKHMPFPVEIAELVNGEASVNRALVAWNRLPALVGAYGPYCDASDVVIDDPVLAQTIENFGGWTRFCAMVDKESFRTEFLWAYRADQRVLPTSGFGNRLLGHDDQEQLPMSSPALN